MRYILLLLVVLALLSFPACSDDNSDQIQELEQRITEIEQQLAGQDTHKPTSTLTPTPLPPAEMVSITGGSFQMGDISGEGEYGNPGT